MSGHLCILGVWSIINAHELILFVDACLLDWYVDGVVRNEESVVNSGSIAFSSMLSPNFYAIGTNCFRIM